MRLRRGKARATGGVPSEALSAQDEALRAGDGLLWRRVLRRVDLVHAAGQDGDRPGGEGGLVGGGIDPARQAGGDREACGAQAWRPDRRRTAGRRARPRGRPRWRGSADGARRSRQWRTGPAAHPAGRPARRDRAHRRPRRSARPWLARAVPRGRWWPSETVARWRRRRGRSRNAPAPRGRSRGRRASCGPASAGRGVRQAEGRDRAGRPNMPLTVREHS